MGVRRAAALLALLALLGAQGTAAFYLPGALAAGGRLTTLPLFEWASALLGGAPARAGLWAIAGAPPGHDRGAGRALEQPAALPLLPPAALFCALRVALLLAHALDACLICVADPAALFGSAGVAPQDFKKVGWAAAAVHACSFGWRPAFGWGASAAASSVACPAARACGGMLTAWRNITWASALGPCGVAAPLRHPPGALCTALLLHRATPSPSRSTS